MAVKLLPKWTKEEKQEILRERRNSLRRRVTINKDNNPQAYLNYLTTFLLGERCLGMGLDGKDRIDKEYHAFIEELREKGYPQRKIDKMVSAASRRYKFGFETLRVCRRAKFAG